MSRTLSRLLIATLLGLLAVGIAAPAMASGSPTLVAAESPEEAEEAPAEVGPSGAYIDAPAQDDAGITPAWTYRFLIPTSLVLIAAVIAGTVIMYFIRVVRTRYTTVG